MNNMQTFPDWAMEQLGPLGIFLVIAGIAFLFFFLLSRWREWDFARKRSSYHVDDFVRDMRVRGVSEEVSRAGYEIIQTEQRVRFPIMPEDALDEQLGITDIDLMDTLVSILGRTGREKKAGLMYMPLITVEDLLKLVQVSPISRQTADSSQAEESRLA
jgi:hypothetical protein